MVGPQQIETREAPMARLQYFVVLHDNQWKVSFQGQHYGPYATQAQAIEVARQWAKDSAARGQPSQVLVQGRDNEWRVEWTYGDDPYPPKG